MNNIHHPSGYMSIQWGVVLPGSIGANYMAMSASESLRAMEKERGRDVVKDDFLNGARLVLVEVRERIIG